MKFKPKYEAKNIVLHLRVRSYLNYHNAETNGTNVCMHAIFPSNRIVYKWPCKTEVFFSVPWVLERQPHLESILEK